MKNKRSCYIFGAGQPPLLPPSPNTNDLVIAADGGYSYTQRERIHVDVLIGDFDSLDESIGNLDKNLIVKRLPKEKDETDLLASLKYGIENGCNEFHIYGGTGKRIDHTLANIQCLIYLVSIGARGYLYSDDSVITVFDKSIVLKAKNSGTVSLFSTGGVSSGVTIRGLKYELTAATLKDSYPQGVSNEFIGLNAEIEVKDGMLMLVYPIGTVEINRR